MRQFLRKSRLTAGGSFILNGSDFVEKHEMKIAFSVSKGIESSQNTAEIEIWNLSEGHRNALGKELDDITLECGYIPPEGGSNNVGIIFKGQTRDIEHRREGPDIITKISCGDGDKALRSATISKTLPAGTPVPDVVEELYKELEKKGIDRGEFKFPDDIDQKKFKRPYSMCGGCMRELDRLGTGKGFYWSIQNGAMELIPGDGYIGSVALITPESGMINYPTITDNGIRVATLLNPEIRPNRRVQVRSQVLEMNAENGMYRVSQATYSGNNRDGDFIVSIQGEAITGGKVDEGKKPT